MAEASTSKTPRQPDEPVLDPQKSDDSESLSETVIEYEETER